VETRLKVLSWVLPVVVLGLELLGPEQVPVQPLVRVGQPQERQLVHQQFPQRLIQR
jgi:hypothetical protein